MNPALAKLQPYPFEKLAKLKAQCSPPEQLNHIALSIGEPKHATPGFITEAVIEHLHGLANYPTTLGSLELRVAIENWLAQRFQLTGYIYASRHILPVNGTREALFAFAQAMVDSSQQKPLVIMPNPFYQIYEGAAILAGAEPYFLNCDPTNNFIPDFSSVDATIWDRCQILYLCSPGNPTGAVIDLDTLVILIELAQQHNFIIAADECYSEIYSDEGNPPAGLLEAAIKAGYPDFSRCVAFHSLSKRSNAPGLRSGFVAGDATIIKHFLHYRTYHGCAMPLATQSASLLAWQDEAHVVFNRTLYREKFAAVLAILADKITVTLPEAGFYLWAETPICDIEFARRLFDQHHVSVLPGSFLARDTDAGNPGKNRIRMALVAPIEECVNAAYRILELIETL